MRLVTGKVVSGKIVVEGQPLAEGTSVTVIARDAGEAFELDAEGVNALLESIAEADRGELVDGDDLLDELSATR